MNKLKKEVENLNRDEEFVKFMSDEEEARLLKNTFINKGIEQGMEKGKIETTKEIAKSMLENNISIDLIIKTTGLSKEEINDLN